MKSKLSLTCAAAAILVITGFGGILTADGRSARSQTYYTQSRNPGTPILAVVGLHEQRISIYDALGKIMEAPVSSGATGYETPAGIYSIVQKEEDHHSNLYDDASMPYMERITWSGMALHAGVLPGYPASHGCVRLPSEFAEHLYEVTKLGMRVIVVRDDIAPAEVAQPFMFGVAKSKSKAPRVGHSLYDGVSPAMDSSDLWPDTDGLSELRMAVAQKSAEAENAARRLKDAKLTASRKAAEASAAAQPVHAAEGNLAKAEADVKAAEHTLETAGGPARAAQAKAAKAQALAKAEAAQAQLQAVKLQAQSKLDAAGLAQEEVRAAEAAFSTAMEATEEAKLNLAPVSVFISRKTQRLYIRKANQPVYEGPVTIRDPDKPIGTFVFTALDYAEQSGGMRWNLVSMYKDPAYVEPPAKGKQGSSKSRHAEPAPADVSGAQAALQRLAISQDAIDRISEVVLPGSSLIISDEGPSIETGKDTDFVVFMSGEPQGGIAMRSHHRSNGWARRGGEWYEDVPWRTSRYRRSGGYSRGGWGWGGFFSD